MIMAEQTRILVEHISLSGSEVGPRNPMPIFAWQQPTLRKSAPPANNLSADELDGAFIWGEASVLPYQVHDGYDRSASTVTIKTIVVENELLRATIFPEYGGRLASLIDLTTGRELLFKNDVFRPANLASLNAWFSGGIEWNGPIAGHSPFTCSDVFCATVNTERGPLLRIYEFDRIKEMGWQIDLYLPPNEKFLYVHGKMLNGSNSIKGCYWWTNAAVPYSAGMRVLSPADYTVEHVLPDNHLERFDFDSHAFDVSRPDNWEYATSVFFRRPLCRRNWIASIGENGSGIAQMSTSEMPGRKMFYFGAGASGQRWMNYLSSERGGAYVEIQAGITPTQNQERIVLPGEAVEWTECWFGIGIDPRIAHAEQYQSACDAVQAQLDCILPESTIQQVDAWLREQADVPASEIQHRGAAWGLLHESISGRRLGKGLDFTSDVTVESPWEELLRTGTFSSDSLATIPEIWVAGETWRSVLISSMAEHGETWLHLMALGIIELDKGHVEIARGRFERSDAYRRTWLSLRNRALVAMDFESSKNLYWEAWNCPGAPWQLAVEIVNWLKGLNKTSELTSFVDMLPENVLQRERIRLAVAHIALERGDLNTVADILEGDFATLREGEMVLSDLWESLQIQIAGHQLGRVLSNDEIVSLKKSRPVPSRIDFRMFPEK
jgi:hypothetical protein